jgi:hypothetical protein
MATIENLDGPAQLENELRKMPDEGLIAQCFVQQGAVHAVSWLMANGCNEETAVEMLASLRNNSELIRREAKRRGKPELFREDQTAFHDA